MTATYTSTLSRLRKLADFGPFFEGRTAMQLFEWSPKTAAQYLWTWSTKDLIVPLGGKSDIFFNKLVHPNALDHLEEAIRRVMPGAVVGPHQVLHAAGISTQRTGTLQLLVRPDERRFQLNPAFASLEVRPSSWWSVMSMVNAMDRGTEAILARLKPGAALVDAATTGSIAPDDIDFAAVAPDERRRALKIMALLNPSSTGVDLEDCYTRAFLQRRSTLASGRPPKLKQS